VFNITSHQRNAQQNAKKCYLTPVRITIIKKRKSTNVGEDVEKRENFHTSHRSVN
jgi:hypothetical protein